MQNITRDIEINNKLTVTRGEGSGNYGGIKRKGHQGTCLKDTWTKPKVGGSQVGGEDGWCRGELWGENGDNCTSTIKTINSNLI